VVEAHEEGSFWSEKRRVTEVFVEEAVRNIMESGLVEAVEGQQE
jgi:hypothetical protein